MDVGCWWGILAERESLKCMGVKEPGEIGYPVHELQAYRVE